LNKNSKRLYPLKPLIIKKQEKLPNIVMLVSESWRWDMLNPEISPATWAFAQNAHQFRHNYSSGNGARMGIFGLFYGLYGPLLVPVFGRRTEPGIDGYGAKARLSDQHVYQRLIFLSGI